MTRACVSGLALLLIATGCRSNSFSEHGTMRSEGNYRNTWQWHPQGCTRDPFDGLPIGKSRSILTLLWENPGFRYPRLANPNFSPDAPLRLEFMPARDGSDGQVEATLHTIDTGGILLDRSVCSTLKLQTQEHAADVAGGRPTLWGELELDCRANGSHITAEVQFERCEY
jgi:hypothetical protein